ncbi:MAG: ABC transporter permease [Thermotogaceae bacterium]|nr:ABC transporter permease [Thermotogaceae bacterium]
MRVETKRTLKRFFRNPSSIIGLSILVFFTLVAIFAPYIAPPVSPMDPSRKIHDPYTMPKISWKQEPIPPTTRKDAEIKFIAEGLEKYVRKVSEEELRPLARNIIEGLDYESKVEVYVKVSITKTKIKNYLKDHLDQLKEAGFVNAENLINSFFENDLVLAAKKSFEILPEFSKYMDSLETEIEKFRKADCIKVVKYGYPKLEYDYAIKVVKDFTKVKGDIIDWMIEKKLITRKPIRAVDYHLFGMIDGRDIFYGVIWGTRTAFRIGLIVTFFSTIIGLVIGSIAGYYGGWIDEVLMRITDVFLSLPFLVAAIVLTTILGTGLDKVMVAMIIFGWMGTARLIRGNILQVKEEQYILAAKALGVKDFFIIMRHVIPNTIFPVVIQASMRMGSLVITAAALSFLGLGAPIGYADWGALLNYSRDWILGAQGEVFKYWFALTYPGIAMVLFVLAWNLLGDALRDTFDPRLRG